MPLKKGICRFYTKAQMKEHSYYVYILTNKNHTVLYIGVTNNLLRRLDEHKSKLNRGFTARYNVDKLVWYEQYSDINEAIMREKRLKKWNREWKVVLINEINPDWVDLSNGFEFAIEKGGSIKN